MLMKMSEYKFVGGENGGDEDRVTEWEVGLLSIDDLMLLSQLLILPELASAFSISPETYRTAVEVNRTSQTTFSTLCGVNHLTADENEIIDRNGSGSDPKRSRKDDECCLEIEVEEADSALRNNENDELSVAAKISDSQTWWISAAMTDQEMCLDGLGREESSSGLERQRECESVSAGERF
uniref:Pectinesterase inhibitor domain-containing protein n=1 Tax=Quercus lobata TaxID=97700 RepID=A0A7N2N1Y6_QUELO